MLQRTRLNDLCQRSNPTASEKKELQAHYEEFQAKLTQLQEEYGIAIVPQISLNPLPSPILKP